MLMLNNKNTYFNPRPREGSDGGRGELYRKVGISIHAPREGSDEIQRMKGNIDSIISIHAPREGSD